MRPSGTPRHTSFEEYDLASNGSEADTSRLDLYRNPAPNLSFMDEPEGLLFGGLSVSMKSDSLRNLNIVSQGPPLPQELRSPSTHQALHPMQDPMYTEENHRAHRPQSMSNLRSAPPPPSLMGGSVDSPQMPYHPASVNSSPRINGVHYPSPSMGHQSPAGMMPPPPPSPQMVEMNRYPAPRPTPFDGGGRYNIQVPDDFAAYSHVFQHQQQHQQPFAQMQPPPRMMGGGGGLYHVTPPMQYSPPPTYSNTPPLSYRPTPRFVPPLVENHNLHYRPNREQQIANLAKAKLQAESKSATTSAESSPMTSLKEVPPFTSSSSSSVASPAVSLSSSVPPVTPGSAVSGVSGNNLAASGAAAGAGGGVSVKSASPPPTPFSPQVDLRKAAVEKKDIVVYMVKQKVSCMYCIASNANLRLSLNDYVVVAVEGGEDVGVIGSCLSLSYFMDNFDLTNEEETLMAMKCIVRLASEKEKNDVAVNAKEEARLVEVISELNRTAFQFPITIMDTEYQVDRKKLTIYYDTLETGATIDIKELLRGVYPIVQTKVSCKKVTSKPSKSGSGSVGGGGVSRTNSFKL